MCRDDYFAVYEKLDIRVGNVYEVDFTGYFPSCDDSRTVHINKIGENSSFSTFGFFKNREIFTVIGLDSYLHNGNNFLYSDVQIFYNGSKHNLTYLPKGLERRFKYLLKKIN